MTNAKKAMMVAATLGVVGYLSLAHGQTCTLEDFEGPNQGDPIGTAFGPVNIVFGQSWKALIDANAPGGSGNFANEPSPSTTGYLRPDMSDIQITFSQGVKSVEFWYSAIGVGFPSGIPGDGALPLQVSAFNESGGLVRRLLLTEGGTIWDEGVDCDGDPHGQFCHWEQASLSSTTSNIHSLEILPLGPAWKDFLIDDFQVCVGDCAPLSGPPVSVRVPIAASCPPANPGTQCAQQSDFDADGRTDCKLWESTSDAMEKLELWCIDDDIPMYQLYFTAPGGQAELAGVCPWECGRNTGRLFHAGDETPANGTPDCFIRTWWRSFDGDANNTGISSCDDDDGDGLVDWYTFTYDVEANKLSYSQVESADGPQGTGTQTVVSRVDPPLGPETAAFFIALRDALQLRAPAGGPMGEFDFPICDLDGDLDCDGADAAVFDGALDTCLGDAGYAPLADGDGDDCVTLQDGPVVVPPRLIVNPSAVSPGDLALSWSGLCFPAAQNYGIYEGDLGNWYSHEKLDCSDDDGDRFEEVTPGTGSHYYLVVPHDDAEEYSYGTDSSDNPRPQPTSNGKRCFPIQGAGACPP